MDDETHTTSIEFTPQLDLDIVNRTYNAAFINHSARDINISECTTNVTFTTAPSLPDDFRRIPWGDIDLLHEIHVDYESCIVNLRRKRVCARRVYSARVEGRKSKVTVAMYEGDGAEEEWQQAIEKQRSLRHPNIIQIWCTAKSGNMHATLFHDDLIPLQHILDLYGHSHFRTVYTYVCSMSDFNEADWYFASKFQRDLESSDCTFWIRRSTGRLCAEFISSRNSIDLGYAFDEGAVSFLSDGHHLLNASVEDAMVIKALPLEVYHDICSHNLGHSTRVSIPTHIPVQPGSVIHWSPSSQHQVCIEIASLPVFVGILSWNDSNELMEDEWTRFCSGDVSNTSIKIQVYAEQIYEAWLTQANNIFGRLGITSNLEDYVLVSSMWFTLEILPTTEDPPAGFLFLCPSEDFRTGPESVGWPDCPAYWSLDPSGVDRLSMEDATRLGFPAVQQTIEIEGRYWDDSVYNGLRQFHRGKGLDPNSQDVALHLWEPLFNLSSEINPLFAHVSEEDVDEDEDDHDHEESLSSEGSVCIAETIPAKRSFDETIMGTHEDIPIETGSGAQEHDKLALRRLMLDEKAQLIEMHRLGIFTKEEFIARLERIEAEHEEIGTWPSPVKRARLSN